MRNIYMILVGLLLLGMTGACSDGNDTAPRVVPDAEGDFTDVRDGSTYRWVRYGNLEWMAENVRIKVSEGTCQIYSETQLTTEERVEQEAKNVQRYGYLYDYEAAESAVPEGWRIPTDEDWQDLERIMGVAENELAASAWRGKYAGEILQQKEGMWLRPGGFMDYDADALVNPYTPNYIGFYGFFWTSTRDTSKENAMIYRQIRYNSSEMGRFSTLPQKMMSLRCVRNRSSEVM